jgi:hypothetical protein
MILKYARRTTTFRFTMPLFRGVAEAALYCAHRTSTFLSCAFCEQEGHLAAPFPSSKLARFSLLAGDPIGLPLRASKDINDPSKLARFSLKGVAWISPQLRTSNDHSFIVGVP